MAHTLATLSDGDLVRKALDFLHNKLKFVKTINKQYDNRFAVEGAKNGGSLLIRNPNEFEVTDGAIMATADITETYQTLTVATQKHVALPNFTSLERTMSVQDFDDNYLEPAMARLAAEVESVTLASTYKDIYNITGTVDTTPDNLLSVRLANARLTKGLAPMENRHFMTESLAMANTTNSMNTYFHKASEIDSSFTEGYVGRAANMKWWENEMLPTHTNGTRTDTTPVCNTTEASGITSGTATITTTAGSSGTMTVGDVFTVADVYAVNQETKTRYDHLQQFVVTTAVSDASGTEVIAVSPTPYTSGARQNVEVVSAGAGKLVLNLTAGGSGAAGGVTTQSLAYHRDFCTFVTADLHMDPSATMSRANFDGISLRYWRSSDIINDKFPARIDVLFGSKVLRPAHAVRVRSD